MKSIASSAMTLISKLDSEKIRMILLVGTLVLFVLAAGAPGAAGGAGG